MGSHGLFAGVVPRTPGGEIPQRESEAIAHGLLQEAEPRATVVVQVLARAENAPVSIVSTLMMRKGKRSRDNWKHDGMLLLR